MRDFLYGSIMKEIVMICCLMFACVYYESCGF